MTTARKVMDIARSQVGYCESPANSNRTKYGKAFGLNGQPWCFILEWWCGYKANQKNNPFPHNASAAYGQDEIVSKRGGKWIMRKNKSRTTRKAALKKYRQGDCVDFDFGAMDAYRRHTGLVDYVSGEYVYCIEGNTTPDGRKGSQSNGGMVARKKRHYTEICSCARPKYSDSDKDVPLEPLVVDGGMGYDTVSRLQRWLGVAEDGEIGRKTIMALQARIGAVTDGLWGKATTKCLQRFLNAHDNAKLTVDGECGKATIRALQRYLNKVVTK